MKRLSVISLIFSLLFILSCEDKVEKDKTSPTIFFRTFGETNNNVVGVSVQQTKDDGYIILGSEYDGKSKSFLLKTDPNGIQEWNKKYGDGFPSSVEQSIDGGYVFLKNVYNDGTLIKVDSLGNEQWNKSLNGKGESIRQTSDGGWIITGSKNGSKILLIKIDSQGNEEWNKTFGGSNTEKGYSVQQTTDGGYIIIGYTKLNDEKKLDYLLVKTDSQGNEEWKKIYGSNLSEFSNNVHQTSDGGYIFTGSSSSLDSGIKNNISLHKTDSEGNEEWEKKLFDGYGGSFQQTIDNGFIITGRSNDKLIYLKTDSNGSENWEKQLNLSGETMGNSLKLTSDNGFIITGHYDENKVGKYILILLKTDSEGNFE